MENFPRVNGQQHVSDHDDDGVLCDQPFQKPKTCPGAGEEAEQSCWSGALEETDEVCNWTAEVCPFVCLFQISHGEKSVRLFGKGALHMSSGLFV